MAVDYNTREQEPTEISKLGQLESSSSSSSSTSASELEMKDSTPRLLPEETTQEPPIATSGSRSLSLVTDEQ